MYVIPLKWFPWLLVIAGAVMVVSGEAGGMVALLIGIVWLVIRYNNKNKKPAATGSTVNRSNVNNTVNRSTTGNTVNRNTINIGNSNSGFTVNNSAIVCPNCKAAMESDMSFCMKCGAKLK